MASLKIRGWLDLATTGLIIATCAVLLWAAIMAPRPSKRRTPSVPKSPVSIEGAPTKGSQSAKVVIIEYADFQCPYCVAFERKTMPDLEAAFVRTGQVQLVFRHHPIEPIHPLATNAAHAAACAGHQGKFWEMQAALFENPKDLAADGLLKKAQLISLDPDAFGRCLGDRDTARLVRRDIEEAQAFGLLGTPAFLVGTRQSDGRVRVASVISGAAPFQSFKDAIDPLLQSNSMTRGSRWQPLSVLIWGAILSFGVAILIVGRRIRLPWGIRLRRPGGREEKGL